MSNRVKLRRYSQLKFGIALGIGALVAAVLCVQCVRTYVYTDAVLVPQQAEREAERQQGALTTAARSAGVTEVKALGPVIEHTLEAAGNRVLWIRILNGDGEVVAQGGRPQGKAKIPAHWWERMEAHKSLGELVNTQQGKAWLTTLPFRLPRPPQFVSGKLPMGHPVAYMMELAIPLDAVAGAFEGLRQNLIVGVIASMALLLALGVIGFRAPQYLRGQYLESELRLARRVQNDLQPKPQPISPHIEFGASAVAADQVGGDFYDIFEAESGKISIVLGDVSGKGVPAALLVSVLQGAIRSSTASKHERACERINQMLCERTACERFATLFWGVFDPASRTLRYVNAGHAAPMLIRQNETLRLDEGGPVLGLLPTARYSAGMVQIDACDKLVLYSDGINEATNQNDEEFGEDRIRDLICGDTSAAPQKMCDQVMTRVGVFASGGVPPDDRTFLMVRFPQAEVVPAERACEDLGVSTAA